MSDKKKDSNEKDKKAPISKPDPETLHTTDPQDEMKGPVSSVVQNIKEEAEDNDKEEKPDSKNKDK